MTSPVVLKWPSRFQLLEAPVEIFGRETDQAVGPLAAISAIVR